MSSLIIVGNGHVLPINSIGDMVLPGPFTLTISLLLLTLFRIFCLFIKFTTDNSCSMKFDPFGLSVKDLATRDMIIRSNSSGLVYTLCSLL
jgi:hypothetical protein